MTPSSRAQPGQAALASAASFSMGAALALLAAILAGQLHPFLVIPLISSSSVVVLGALSAWLGQAPVWVGACRVTLWGMLAMAVTAGSGIVVGTF